MKAIKPQLAENVDPARIEEMIKSRRWGMQQKLDGKRTLVSVSPVSKPMGIETRDVQSWNRWGNTDVLPDWTYAQFKKTEVDNPTIFDGELIANSVFWCFDLLMPGVSFRNRYKALSDGSTYGAGYSGFTNAAMGIVPTAWSEDEKRTMLTWCVDNHAEGVIFRYGPGEYKPGVRNSDMLKLKFTKTADVLVWAKGKNNKRNLQLAVVKNGKPVDIGSVGSGVTDERYERAQIGDVVEVRYLYLTERGRLFQPAFISFRPEKPAHECDWGQLVPTNRAIYS